MEIDYSIIGQRLKEARIRCGYTQNTLSELLDISVAYLSRIEKGRAQINLKRLTQICEILDISIGEILTGTSIESKQYLSRELYDILISCTPEKQRLIYEIAQLVQQTNFI